MSVKKDCREYYEKELVPREDLEPHPKLTPGPQSKCRKKLMVNIINGGECPEKCPGYKKKPIREIE